MNRQQKDFSEVLFISVAIYEKSNHAFEIRVSHNLERSYFKAHRI